MVIQKTVLNQIKQAATSHTGEIGGILGTSTGTSITDVVFDLPNREKTCRFEYYPNVPFLNAQIEAWAEKDIEFMGIFHTHFSGSRSLSVEDKKYIHRIMDSAKGISPSLFFPIFTLPDNTMTAFRAYWEQEDLIIQQEPLEIV